MIIGTFEIHLKPPLSQSIPLPLDSFVRIYEFSPKMVRSKSLRIQTAYSYRIRYLNDTSVPRDIAISVQYAIYTDARTVQIQSRLQIAVKHKLR